MLLIAGYDPHRQLLLVAGALVRGQLQAALLVYPGAGQDVPGCELVAAQATQPFPYHGGGTAKLRRHGKSTGDTEIAAAAIRAVAEADVVACLNPVHGPQVPLVAVDRQRNGRPGNADEGIGVGVQFQPAKACLDRGAGRVVAQQALAQAEGFAVQGATGGEADAVLAKTARVLEQTQQTGLAHDQAHASSPPSSRNRARLIGSKRTRSPTATGIVGSASGSNMRCGQLPIRFQPPGDTAG